MKIRVVVMRYEVVVFKDQPELVAIETGEFLEIDLPVKNGKLDSSGIPEEKIFCEYKTDGIYIPYVLLAPKYVLIPPS